MAGWPSSPTPHSRCPRASLCPSACATGSTALSLALRATSRPFFAAVARCHRCRGRRGRLCAWPGRSGPSQDMQDGPTSPLCSLGARPPPFAAVENHGGRKSERRRGCRSRRWLTWSALHRQSSSEFGPPTGAAGHVDAPGPLLRRWRSPRRPESRAPANCSVSGRGMKLMDFALKFEKRGGPNCEVSDSCE